MDFADQSYLRSYLEDILVLCRQSPRDKPSNPLILVGAGPAESTARSVESTPRSGSILSPQKCDSEPFQGRCVRTLGGTGAAGVAKVHTSSAKPGVSMVGRVHTLYVSWRAALAKVGLVQVSNLPGSEFAEPRGKPLVNSKPSGRG